MAMLHEIVNQVFEVEQFGTTLDQGDVVHAEGRLQGGELEQLVEHDIGIGIFLDVDDNAHAAAVGFIVDIGDTFDLLVTHQVGNGLDELGLVDTVGNLGDDDLVVRGGGFNGGFRTDDDASLACLEGFLDTGIAVDVAACREIGCLDVVHQLLDRDVVVVDVGHRAVDDFRQVVGGHVGGHTHGNAGSAVDQQVGNAGRQYSRFLEGVVEVHLEVDGVFVDIQEHILGDLAQAAFRVTHGSRAVTVDRAEVALAVHQRITHVPVLSQADHGEIYGGIAVGMVFAQYVTDDSCRFLIGFVRVVAQFVHSEQNTAMNRLHSVSYIGQGAGYNHRHRIVYVGGPHLLFDVYRNNSLIFKHLIQVYKGLVKSCKCRTFHPFFQIKKRSFLCLSPKNKTDNLSHGRIFEGR